ncbi:hypothetical protein DNTS_004258, partial [Danionella cerebrum]
MSAFVSPTNAYLFRNVPTGLFASEFLLSQTLSVTEGDSVTLHTNLTVSRSDHLLWSFDLPTEPLMIAELQRWSFMISFQTSGTEIFRERLMLDHWSGSLTIRNTQTEHSGVYTLTLIRTRTRFTKRFRLTVNAAVLVPIITSDISSFRASRSQCVLLCSVKNVSRVTLSFFRGTDLLSSTDKTNSLSQSLEIEGRDDYIYRCVVNDSISSQATVFYTADLCPQKSGMREKI